MLGNGGKKSPLQRCGIPARATRLKERVSLANKAVSQCQAEQTDDESEGTEEEGSTIMDYCEVQERQALNIQTVKTAVTVTRSSSQGQDHGDTFTVTSVLQASPSPAVAQERVEPPLSSVQRESSKNSPRTSQDQDAVEVEPLPAFPIRAPLKSILKSSKAKRTLGPTKRRVRGLWNENCACPFSNLHDDLLLNILSYGAMDTLIQTSMVCTRWKYVALSERSWKHVDATDFVLKTHSYLLGKSGESVVDPAQATSSALSARLQEHAPERLTIRSIEHRLTADTFLPSVQGLQELTLTAFSDLSDTHVHVMLLSAGDARARCKKENVLTKLAIEQCPELTNTSIRSIALHCPNLTQLSLAGSRQLNNVMELKNAWKVQEDAQPRGMMSHSQSMLATMSSLFAPPLSPAQASAVASTPPPPMARVVSSSPAPSSSSQANLAFLFTPPGMSPPRRSGGGSSFLTAASSVKPGKLTRVNLSSTQVTAQAIVDSVSDTAAAAAGIVELESLEMRGSGESWRDAHCHGLANKLAPNTLTVLDIGCANAWSGASNLTDAGLESLSTVGSGLQRLGLAGHTLVRATGIANVLSAAIDLVDLDLEGCKGVGSNADSAGTISLARALLQHKGGSCNGGLQRLSLARCFSNEKTCAALSDKAIAAESKRGNVLLKTICKSPSSQTLRHLDLTGCWFVTLGNEALLRRSLPRLDTLFVSGTRCTMKD